MDAVENAFPEKGLVFLDGDTVVSPGSKDATFDAVGSIIAAIDGVEKKEFNAAHCVTRPPGFWRLSSLIREAQTNWTSR